VHATEQLVQAVCHIWMAATVLGAGSPVAADKLYKAFRPEFELVKRSADRNAELLDSIELAPQESLLQAAGIFSDGNIIPILPDILGEFFVLTGFDSPVFRQRLWVAAMGEFDSALEFFKRLLKDFGQMMAEDDGLRRRVFPEDPGLDDRKTQLYARLLRRLFDEPNDRPVREAPKKTLVALADGRQGNTEENFVIWSDAGSVCRNMGEHERALGFLLKSVKASEESRGGEDTETATAYNNIASLYQAMGDYDKALEFNLKALKVREKVLVAEHPDTAAAYNNIAQVYQDIGDYAKALEFNMKALKVMEKVLGAEHPSTAATYNNIAQVYQAMGDYDKALKYMKKDLAISEKMLGAEHPSTAVTYANIGALRLKQNNHAEAVKYLTKACDVFDKKLGPGHPNTKLAHQWLDAALKLPSD
ncbi:MAG: tetratricopeptide repeat protein, partial [Clostridia bacterium]|nr:tetratricopeptide repeat protein [Clostridia bacterium]